ncbi:zn-finger protein [Nitrososphaeria virus YSH_1032793]|uniref:Zn-finger protein n=1 Tax=Nitrososphaeria virus YSH_1032793 TaxID=3071320 RepID=A0A976UAC1_9CAUD|nr:zn-finger protein [Yangshan Harbor Nitrososphaeria virus]UVF62235.1 zn-finger protein [Nitrososphaeria virus YSH_1032793]
MTKCSKCNGDLVKEKFDSNYNGVEAKKLRCPNCGIWVSENSSDKKQKEKSD